MCGIAGIFLHHADAGPVSKTELLTIRDAMEKRGPDGAGIWISKNERVGLAHRRLAIIDLSPTGAQPMSTVDGRLHITFNGEIYNYRALRKELEAQGCRFQSSSDTEVLLHLYATRGAEMVHALRGMYTFAIYDARDNSLFLARDPFGIKPLYYSTDSKGLRFASQVKALLKSGAIDTSPEPAGHVGFLLWGHVPDPYTLYKGVRALPAGATLTVDTNGKKTLRKFFDIADEIVRAREETSQASYAEMLAQFHDGLLDSVRHHLIADVPVGVFLSAGIDSTTITSLAKEATESELRTITLGFAEFAGTENDEVPLAKLIASHFGVLHDVRVIGREEFLEEHAALLEAMDQPSIDGVNSYFISRTASRAGLKVALSGLGGDELFGGYPSFEQIPRLVRNLKKLHASPVIGRRFRKVTAPLMKLFTSPKYAGVLEYGDTYGGAYLLRRGLFMPWELPGLLDADLLREGWDELKPLQALDETTRGVENDHLKIAALETDWYMKNQLLRDADWASMAHSLEVRVPFVDVTMFRKFLPLLHALPKPSKKVMTAALKYPLPEVVLQRKKTGFSVPVRDWLLQFDRRNERERGLRGWAKHIYTPPAKKNLRVLALVPDAFGGHGGIALYNRDLLTAICADPNVAEVLAIPRLAPKPIGQLPDKLIFPADALNSKIRYMVSVIRHLLANPRFDLIICGHINLVPLAIVAKIMTRAPVLLEIYGIDAWRPADSKLSNLLVRHVDQVISISEVTRERFLGWANIPTKAIRILPNAIHVDQYGMGPKNPSLLARYDLAEKVVLMTLGRIVSQERSKGFDEVLELLPALLKQIPNAAYLIVGDGTDRIRLEQKAAALGIAENVIFAGSISDSEKADHYRLADVYVMPSRGEGFGFVFLEALACGIPTIGSKVDGGREALRDGLLGTLVDPDNQGEIVAAVKNALVAKKHVSDDLHFFGFDHFKKKVGLSVGELVNARSVR